LWFPFEEVAKALSLTSINLSARPFFVLGPIPLFVIMDVVKTIYIMFIACSLCFELELIQPTFLARLTKFVTHPF
jgi:hypothetical protein